MVTLIYCISHILKNQKSTQKRKYFQVFGHKPLSLYFLIEGHSSKLNYHAKRMKNNDEVAKEIAFVSLSGGVPLTVE